MPSLASDCCGAPTITAGSDEGTMYAVCGFCDEPCTPVAAPLIRFRIEIIEHATGGWEATVYDHADHGPDLMYAGVTAGSLDQVLDHAVHYVLVAASDTPPTPLSHG
jgi:hypothetical protein